MKSAAKILAAAGCLAILFGFLALDFIPGRIMAALPPDQRAHTDRSLVEMEWITRGLDSIAVGAGMLVAALVLYVIGSRKSGAGQLQSK